jgi:hypothetical protein
MHAPIPNQSDARFGIWAAVVLFGLAILSFAVGIAPASGPASAFFLSVKRLLRFLPDGS